MKTILVLISIMILGLYSCGDESTNPTPNPNEEIKKYTLEEILADTNWVEITDKFEYDKNYLKGYSYLRNKYTFNSILLFNNLEDYYKVETLSDTSEIRPEISKIRYDIDFILYDILGLKTFYFQEMNILKRLYKNEIKKEYQYFVIFNDSTMTLANITSYHFIKIPKLEKDYKLRADTLWRKNNL